MSQLSQPADAWAFDPTSVIAQDSSPRGSTQELHAQLGAYEFSRSRNEKVIIVSPATGAVVLC